MVKISTTINTTDEDIKFLKNIDNSPSKAVKFLITTYAKDTVMLKGEVQKAKNRLAFWKRILERRQTEEEKIKNLTPEETDKIAEQVTRILKAHPDGNDFLWNLIDRHKPHKKLTDEINKILKIFRVKR